MNKLKPKNHLETIRDIDLEYGKDTIELKDVRKYKDGFHRIEQTGNSKVRINETDYNQLRMSGINYHKLRINGTDYTLKVIPSGEYELLVDEIKFDDVNIPQLIVEGFTWGLFDRIEISSNDVSSCSSGNTTNTIEFTTLPITDTLIQNLFRPTPLCESVAVAEVDFETTNANEFTLKDWNGELIGIPTITSIKGIVD